MKYPNVGEQVRIKNETGLHAVTQLWKPGRVMLDTGQIFGVTGLVTRHQKTVKTWIVQGDYGSGWEDVTAEETHSDGRRALRDYRDNDPRHAYRLIVRYEPNDLYQGGES